VNLPNFRAPGNGQGARSRRAAIGPRFFARPDIVLPAGDRRRIYIVMGWQVPETLLIAEDGELLREAVDFNYRQHLD